MVTSVVAAVGLSAACGVTDAASTELCAAIAARDVPRAEKVLAAGPVDWLRQQGACLPARDAFLAADRPEGLRIAIAMLDRGLDPNAIVTTHGGSRIGSRSTMTSTQSLAEIAATLEDPALVNALLAKGLDVKRPGTGQAVAVAAASGNLRAVEVLARSGVDLNQPDDGSTALGVAIQYRHHAVIAFLDGKGAKEAVVDAPPVFRAARLGDVEALRRALATGADVSATNTEGQTALHRAAGFGHLAAVEALVAAKAALNIYAEAETPLHAAAQEGHAAVVRALSRAGADVNARRDDHAPTPLIVAVHARRDEAVAALVEAGADPNRPDGGGDTPLRLAVQQRSLPMVTALLRAKANVNFTPAGHWPVMHVAVTGCEARDYDVPLLTALAKAGADLAAKDGEGRTPRQKVQAAAAEEPRPFYKACHDARAAALAGLGG